MPIIEPAAPCSGDVVGDFNLIVPNGRENGHDPCGGDPVPHFDAFLAREALRVEASPAFGSDGVIFVIWDEGLRIRPAPARPRRARHRNHGDLALNLRQRPGVCRRAERQPVDTPPPAIPGTGSRALTDAGNGHRSDRRKIVSQCAVSRLRLVAMLGCLGVLTALPAPASASYPGADGDVLYTARHDGTNTLYLRSGHEVTLLREDARILPGALFSPHGRRIALARRAAGLGVWVMNADGTDLRRLTSTHFLADQPTWSPEGSAVAFAAGRPGKRDVFVVGADGVGLRRLTRGRRDQGDPTWSVRGEIAYVQRDRHHRAIYAIGAFGGRARRLSSRRHDDSDPAWAPDGGRLAFVRDRRAIWTMGADGGGLRRVAAVRGQAVSAPAWSPDGRSILFSAGPSGGQRIWVVGADGGGLRPLSAASSDGRGPDWQPTGFAPVIMAAGDIACAPDSPNFDHGMGYATECGMLRTSDLLLRSDLDAVLPLGDQQYDRGEYGNYLQSFDSTWGRLRSLLHPVPGNHDYSGPFASGYFDYFDGPGRSEGPAGDRAVGGYYSFDVGAWHLVALNSNCTKIPGGCGPGSPEETWLRSDLAAHPARCTLAYWHQPRFGSAGSNAKVGALWQALYDFGADVVLSGHHHLYERMSPQDPAGGLDPERGIREFIVGTGGKSLVRAGRRKPNDAALGDSTFGVLRLELLPTSYRWRFVSTGDSAFGDGGIGRCH